MSRVAGINPSTGVGDRYNEGRRKGRSRGEMPVAEEPEDTNAQGSPSGEANAAEAPSGGGTAPPAKAELSKRFIAAIIDAVIAIVIGFIPIIGGLIATGYWLVRDGLDVEFMDQRSLGKKVMKLRPVTLDGSPVDIMTSVKRNWIFAISGIAQLFLMTIIGVILAIPLFFLALVLAIIEVVMVLVDADGRRLGDKIANTVVIEVDE